MFVLRHWIPRGRRDRLTLVCGLALVAAFVCLAPLVWSNAVDRAHSILLDRGTPSIQAGVIEEVRKRQSPGCLDALVRCFRGRLAGDASMAVESFGGRATAALARGVCSDDRRVRFWSARTLGKIGGEAQAAYDDLVRLLGDEIDIVRHEAIIAVARVNGLRAARDLAEFAASRAATELDQILAAQATESLGAMGRQALPDLERMRHRARSDRAAEIIDLAIAYLTEARPEN